jgi:hypothetical protein
MEEKMKTRCVTQVVLLVCLAILLLIGCAHTAKTAAVKPTDLPKPAPTLVAFNMPLHIFQDNAGRIFVTDVDNRIMRMDDISGRNKVSFGANGSEAGQFNFPIGFFVDTSGKIYIADSGNNRIVRMDDMSGKNWTTFGTSGSGEGQLNNPEWVFLDSKGKIYVTDNGNNRIVRIDDMTGANWIALGTQGSGKA